MFDRKLKIYFIHSNKIDYNELVYLPVLSSNVLSHYYLILPNSEENKNKYYKDLMDECDIFVCLLTNPDATFNMQLKHALMSKKPILSLAQKSIGYDAKLQKLLKDVIGFNTKEEFVYFIETFARSNENKVASGIKDPTVVLGILN